MVMHTRRILGGAPGGIKLGALLHDWLLITSRRINSKEKTRNDTTISDFPSDFYGNNHKVDFKCYKLITKNDGTSLEMQVRRHPAKSSHDGVGKPGDPSPELRTFSIKLGWIQGVLIPCLLNIWGVMLFLRIAWIVAQAGIGLTLLIILISAIVCVLTTLSLSAICTNGVLQGGGIYYLVSRSLGAELGASVGVLFAFANAVAASMNTIGFCDSLNDLLKRYGLKIMDNSVNDVRIVGTIALLVMCLICAVGMDWETKTQNFLIVIIILAILDYVIGVCVGPLKPSQKARGFVGLNLATATENWKPNFRVLDGKDHNFFSVFAMYFPAVTGVQAGANICGDLKNPAAAIPKGTLLALLISTTSYITMTVLSGIGALRDASGNVEDVAQGTSAIEACKPNCRYGLHNSYEVMQTMALWDLLIFFGCWAATLSTALTNLLAVPRLIQALGKDRIYPGLIYFAKPYGRYGEAYRGYVLTYIVSLIFLLIADLDKIAPLITNFYLASYAMINFCTFHADFVHHLSWRPQFQYYNKWISFLAFLMCLTIMIVISWVMALATVLIFLTLYLLVLYRKPKANWGSSTDAQRYRETVNHLLHLSVEKAPIKSYNPQLLVLAGRPHTRPALLDIGNLITKQGSFMIVADIEKDGLNNEERIELRDSGQKWLRNIKSRGFFMVIDGHELEQGVRALLQTAGLGRLTANVMLIGYMENWFKKPQEDVRSYVRSLQCSLDHQIALSIFRSTGIESLLRRPKQQISFAKLSYEESHIRNQIRDIIHANSDVFLNRATPSPSSNTADLSIQTTDYQSHDLALVNSETLSTGIRSRKDFRSRSYQDDLSEESHTNTLMRSLVFPENTTIDAWWLFDDGGLNILLPYVISSRGFKDKMPLRIFALGSEKYEEEQTLQQMKELLAKFRIQYDTLHIIRGLNEEPSANTWGLLNTLLKDFMTDNDGKSDTLVTRKEYDELFPKTKRYLRLREILQESSSHTSLIILTLPLPRKGQVSAALYMAWLEILSRKMPPILFVRGNAATVLAE